MPDITETIRSESHDFEHKYLREELATNKRLIFERALVIAAVGLAASLLSKDAQGVQLVGIPTIGALAFSLWLTVNRVKSNSRIGLISNCFTRQIVAFHGLVGKALFVFIAYGSSNLQTG